MRNKILQNKEPDNGKTGAVVIIFQEDQLLLIQRRDTSVWVLPGGGIENEETPEDAAIREVKEETGFEIEIVRKIAYYLPINKLSYPAHFFEGKIVGGKAQKTQESKNISFFSPKKLPKRVPPPYPSWIQDALLRHPNILEKKITSVTYKRLLGYLFTHPILVIRFFCARLGFPINI